VCWIDGGEPLLGQGDPARRARDPGATRRKRDGSTGAAGGRCALMRPVRVGELFGLAQGVQQVPLVPDQGPVRSSWRQVCTHRSTVEFILGIRTPLCTTSAPVPPRARSDARWHPASISVGWRARKPRTHTRYHQGG
jgi:hypothetical protein